MEKIKFPISILLAYLLFTFSVENEYENIKPLNKSPCFSHASEGLFSGDQWTWSEQAVILCGFHSLTENENLELLDRRLIVMIGDSQTRHFLSAIARSLGGDMKPGYWKRESDEFMTSLGGRIVWPFFTRLSSDLIGNGPTGLNAALSLLPLADVYVINIGHWNVIQNFNESLSTFSFSLPEIRKELFRIRSLELIPFLDGAQRCRNPLIVWATLNHIIPELYHPIDVSPKRDRPERVKEINDYLHNFSGLFDEGGPSVLLDMNKLSRLGGQSWVSGDFVHGTEEFFKVCWQVLANIISINDNICGR
jgi:hypothetical protein